MWYKPGKEHIILDALSKLVSANSTGHNISYLELDTMFVYYTTLVEINLDLVVYILKSYVADNW